MTDPSRAEAWLNQFQLGDTDMGDEKLEFTISVYTAERLERGRKKTRYTAIQSVDQAYVAADSFEGPEDAVARLAIAASKRGGFIA